MSVVDAVGWIAALSSALLAVPQGARIATTRSVSGVSAITWQTMMFAGPAWTAHGLWYGTPQILWPNALLAATSAWVLWQVIRARRLSVFTTVVPPMLLAAAAFAADVWIGPLAFGVMVFIPSAVGQYTQFHGIRRSVNTAGVSMASLWLQLICQVLWFSYALPVRELAVLSVCTPVGVMVAVSIVTLWLRRSAAGATEVIPGQRRRTRRARRELVS